MPKSWRREIGRMLQGIGIAGESFKRRHWLKTGCNPNDDDDDDSYTAISTVATMTAAAAAAAIVTTTTTTNTTKTLPSTSSFRLKAQIIDGARIARDIRQELKVEVDEWVAQGNRRPHLTALLVGEDPASATYVKNKMQAAREIGKRQI